ncbi:hypothetical protein EXIGLDRAFT_695721 [Exidia glandulosa HHB12029]|uniref:F-box domain-containing protein n=1 Tax=Exidia glandulosa HHB12029 TaxID=1314781 RepID=A0A165FNV7_EXIGL|nr:hypothetical protein EXIGLDRAFT_695721 [Exidia glandulosa HHB12029]
MLSDTQQREFADLTLAFAKRVSCDMAHDSNGVLYDYEVRLFFNSMRYALTTAMNDFARERNTRLPVNKLPPEVLLLMGSFLPYGALDAAAQTCRRWCTILRSDASLWADIVLDFDGPGSWRSATRNALERCQSKPRSLVIRLSYSWYETSAVSALISESSIMQHLDHLGIWLCKDIAAKKDWHPLVTSPAPALRTLLVGTISNDTPPPLLPSNLFAGNCPKLYSIWLSNVLFTNPFTPMPQILDFAFLDFKDAPITEVSAVLDACPDLVSLTVDASESCSDYIPPLFVPRPIPFLRLGFWVPYGILHELVQASTSNCELRIRKSGIIQLPLTGFRRIERVHVLFDDAGAGTASLIVQGDDNCVKSVEEMSFRKLVDLFSDGSALRLCNMTHLSLPDSMWAILLSTTFLDGDVVCLQSLTVGLSNKLLELPGPFPRLFTSSEHSTTRAYNLRVPIVRLSAWGSSDSVDLSIEAVAAWLPTSTTRLLLSGVNLTGSKSAMPDSIIVEKEFPWCSGGNERYLQWRPAWYAEFPRSEALVV